MSLRTTLQSLIAVLLGLAAVFILSFGTNKLVRILGVFSDGSPVAALIYRSAYMVLGGYIAASFAPSRPIAHALTLGVIQFIFASFSAIVVIHMQFFGPTWYYIGLCITSFLCAWFGGLLHRRVHRQTL